MLYSCAPNFFGDAPMSDKLKPVVVRLEPALRERLQQAADQDQRSLAGLIRKICHQAVAGLEHPHAA
jgi:predicted HicB family RNase H-like nuclease